MKKKVVFAFLGTIHDSGFNEKRWKRWRPTIALLGHPDEFEVGRIELFYTADGNKDLLKRITADIQAVSPDTTVHTHQLDVGSSPWDFSTVYGSLFDFAKQYSFDTQNEDYYLQTASGTHVAKICLFLLSESRIFPAKLVTTFADKALKNEDEEAWRGQIRVIDMQLERYSAIAQRFEKVATDNQSVLRNGIVTLNHDFNQMIEEVELVAIRSNSSMLITGPTGAGKSQLVSKIHQLKQSKDLISGGFVEVNCATLRGDNALSTLFGHKKGAFTGAVSDRDGMLKKANHGILFLDEIGELGLDEQAMLLKAIEEKKFTPLGSDQEVKSDFQLIAGTNRDLRQEVLNGRFRGDLLSRLNVWEFDLPSLSQRSEDIPPNIEYELQRQSIKVKKPVTMSTEAFTDYTQFAVHATWPGNFRDLGASIERMATLSTGGRIDRHEVQSEIKKLSRKWQQTPCQASRSIDSLVDQVLTKEAVAGLSLLDKSQLEVILKCVTTSGTVAEMAKMLEQTADRQNANWSDRGAKILSRFNLNYKDIKKKLLETAP